METITPPELIAKMLRNAGYTAIVLPNTSIVELPHKNLTITIEGQKIIIGPTYGLLPIEFKELSSMATARTMIEKMDRTTRIIELADPSFRSKLLYIIELKLGLHQRCRLGAVDLSVMPGQ